MRKYNRIFLIVLDSLGIGAMADSEKFGDVGVNTFGHIWESQGGLEIPNLRRLGMGNLCGVTEDEAKGYARRLNEASNRKRHHDRPLGDDGNLHDKAVRYVHRSRISERTDR